MPRTANISVSLPTETIRQVRRYAHAHGTTVSRAVRESLESLLRRQDKAAIEREFAEYYADPRMRAEDPKLVEQLFKASAWWEAVHGRRRPEKGRHLHYRLRRRG